VNLWTTRVTTDVADDRRTRTRMPDDATSLVFGILPNGTSHLVVLGPRAQATYFASKDIPLTVSVRFRPGQARIVTGLPVSEMVGRTVPLSDLWGEPAVRLLDELRANPETVAERIDRALWDRFEKMSNAQQSRGDLVTAAAAMLPGERVGNMARKLNVSERHLRNLFNDTVGLSPKQVTRVKRVRTVLARANRQKGARLAADSGYYDQSHMAAEFRDTMGLPLGAYIAGQRPPERGRC
jgi:AraC-like DNA-binding protein